MKSDSEADYRNLNGDEEKDRGHRRSLAGRRGPARARRQEAVEMQPMQPAQLLPPAGFEVEPRLDFEARIIAAMQGDDMACWTLVWQCLHEPKTFEIGPGEEKSKLAILEEIVFQRFDRKNPHDNFKVILGTMLYQWPANNDRVPADSYRNAVEYFNQINRHSPQVYYLLAKMSFQGLYRQEDRHNFADAKQCDRFLGNSVQAMITLAQQSEIKAHISEYEQNAILQGVLSLEGRAQLCRAYGYVDQLEEYARRYIDNFVVCYHYFQFKVKSGNFATRMNRTKLAKSNPDLYLNTLLNDELLTIKEVTECLAEFNVKDGLANAILKGESSVTDQTLVSLGQFIIRLMAFESYTKEPEFVKKMHPENIFYNRFDALLHSILKHFERVNLLEHQKILVTWHLTKVKAVLFYERVDDEVFFWVSATLNLIAVSSDARALWACYLHREDISEAFNDLEKLQIIVIMLAKAEGPILESELAPDDGLIILDEYITLISAEQGANNQDLLISSWQNIFLQCRDLAKNISEEQSDKLIQKFKQYLLYRNQRSREFARTEPQQHTPHLAFERYCNKQPLLTVLEAVKKTMVLNETSLLARFSVIVHSDDSPKNENKNRFNHLISYYKSTKAHTAKGWCAARIVAFLRHENTLLGPHTYAECLMRELAKYINFDFAALVAKHDKDPVNIRNAFTAHFEYIFCKYELSTGPSPGLAMNSAGK
jgi:hypothetical protein